MQRSLFTIAILALSLALPKPAICQITVPPDINAPAPDVGDSGGRADIPTRLEAVVLPEVQFVFDGLLDPDRISLIEKVTTANLGDVRLTTAARSLIRNHLIAMQQVELAIQFLQANRDNILTGTNSNFNSIFGNPGELREVAVVNPTPLSGMANVRISQAGLIDLQFRDNDIPNLPAQVKVGDYVFVGDAPNNDPNGFIMSVKQVLFDVDGANQSLMGSGTFGGPLTGANRGNLLVYKIINFEQRVDTARYQRVLQTFQAIRDSLEGLDVNLIPSLQTQNKITYQRRFADINRVWAPGVAQFTPLEEVVQRELDRYGGTSILTADRLVRQAGLSTSDSYDHIQQLNMASRGQPVFPLLWTEDNNLPRNAEGDLINTATDEARAFFRDQQTIFGTPDDPFTQYIGRAFLEETIVHAGDFFDDNIAVIQSNNQSTFTTVTTLPNGQTVTTTQMLSDPLQLVQLPSGVIVQRPESGMNIIESTELRKWQMIIESFAEHHQDFDMMNVAAIGVASMFGDFVPDDLKARDAGNYAKFAALIGTSSDLGSIDVTRIEPFGKRATAGFNPIVPRN